DRMIANAEEAGANAVLCMRFATSTVMSGMAEFLAYGTAVKIEPVS
ncbi:MAG: heavy metal-binding domain-containing protein, partial [Candidatus Neomarinimicrobiota bacterium]|nr:heavy metal-binding domain-containing protein [Candidatus Neomarinimicrobiota bacterium]